MQSDQLNLPKGLFPSKEEEEVGMLNKAAPLVGEFGTIILS